jgi:hypothetical protein
MLNTLLDKIKPTQGHVDFSPHHVIRYAYGLRASHCDSLILLWTRPIHLRTVRNVCEWGAVVSGY